MGWLPASPTGLATGGGCTARLSSGASGGRCRIAFTQSLASRQAWYQQLGSRASATFCLHAAHAFGFSSQIMRVPLTVISMRFYP